ncbi:GGDEF domain-containing protein [Ochrobactrum sp. GPK 3]
MINSALEWSVPLLILVCGFGLIGAARFGFPTVSWGSGLCLLGAGYGLMLFRTVTFSAVKPLGEDSIIMAGVASCCRALAERFNIRKKPVLDANIVVIFLGMAALSLMVFQSVRLETLSILTGSASLILASLWRVKSKVKSSSDIIFFATFGAIFLFLLFQCGVYLFLNDLAPEVGSWSGSFWGVVLQYTGLFGVVILTFAIVLAVSMDVIDRYRDLANTDSLTRVHNRRGMQAFIRSFQLDTMSGEQAAIVLADIDHFKTVNDQYGHHAGDMVLADFAQLLQEQAGHGSCVARLGGEEFVVLLPRTPMKAAITIVEDLRCSFAARRWYHISANLRLTASFGVTVLEHGESFKSAITRADTYLYRAKLEGRDRLVGDKAA